MSTPAFRVTGRHFRRREVLRETDESGCTVCRKLCANFRAALRGELPPTRDVEVLYLLASGSSTESICARLGIQVTTFRTHVQHILDKLGVHSRLEAVAYASRNGWLGSDGGGR